MMTTTKHHEQLYPGQTVLTRDSFKQNWRLNIFSNLKEDAEFDILKNRYVCVAGTCKYCIPYEGNEHLLGTKQNIQQQTKSEFEFGDKVLVWNDDSWHRYKAIFIEKKQLGRGINYKVMYRNSTRNIEIEYFTYCEHSNWELSHE